MPSSSSNKALRLWQIAIFAGCVLFWHAATSPTLLPPIYFDDPNKAAFFFGEPLKVFERTWDWFSSGSIYPHLWVTLLETLLAFVIGTALGLGMGLWLALAPTASALLDPWSASFMLKSWRANRSPQRPVRVDAIRDQTR